MSINRVSITGRLTRDPELRQSSKGTYVLGFSVAVNGRRKNAQTGEWEDEATFVDCVQFGHGADRLAERLSKGSKVAVDGRLRQSTWEDRQTGQRRSKLEVVCNEVDLMGAKPQEPDVYDGDIPF